MRNALTEFDLRRLAVSAEVDPRTATRWLAGLPVHVGSRARLERAAATLGVVPASSGMNASELEHAAVGRMRA
jgi:hypothetical protein